jgi:phosphatidylglycerol lysyltransferase
MESEARNRASLAHTDPIRHIIRYLIGLITGLVGIGDMLSAIVPKLNWDIPLGAWPIVDHRVPAQTFTVVVGFFLIMLSYGLARGKHHAWLITVLLLILSALLHVRRSGSVLATVTALVLAILLSILAHFFQARSDPPSVRRGYVALGLGLGIVTFYTIGGFIVLYNSCEHWIDRVGIDGVILHLIFHGPYHFPHASPANFFEHALPLLCTSAVLYGMFCIFRPVAAVLIPHTEERDRVIQLVHRYGKSTISHFALSEEKSYFFSTSGNSVISYVLEGSTAVVAGDPIGPDNELLDMIQQFIQFCSEQDWTIVFWQTHDAISSLYRQAHFHLLKIGEDAVVNPQTFTLKGGAMANIRSSAKRAEKDGVYVIFYRGQVTNSEQLAQMESISSHWLMSKAGTEMGFSMGRFSPHGNPEELYALAVDPNNKVHAFASFVPIYGRYGWGLDLMRRAENCAPGTMELLLARSIEYMKTSGCEMMSLGLAPLSNANGEDETFLGTSIDFLTERFGNPSKNQSLFNFKKKFQPTWESRYVVYSGALSLPKIGWALYHAHQTDISLLKALRQSLLEWQKNRQVQQEKAPGALEAVRI